MTDEQRIQHAAYRLLVDPELRPLVQAWELNITNAPALTSPIDPLHLAGREGDRQRLLWVKLQAEEYRTRMEQQHAPSPQAADRPRASRRARRIGSGTDSPGG